MENAPDITALMILFGTTLMGIIQVYQRSVTRHGDETEDKNDELLALERKNLRNEIKVEILQTHLLKQQKKYRKLVKAVKENSDTDTLASIRGAIK